MKVRVARAFIVVVFLPARTSAHDSLQFSYTIVILLCGGMCRGPRCIVRARVCL